MQVETQPLLGQGGGQEEGGGRGRRRKSRAGRDVTAPDKELVDSATKFVEEIIEKAKVEAALRLKDEKAVSTPAIQRQGGQEQRRIFMYILLF